MEQLVQMIDGIKKCEAAGALYACMMQIYVYIDTMAYFGMPISKSKNTRQDFIDWVDKYLEAENLNRINIEGLMFMAPGAPC